MKVKTIRHSIPFSTWPFAKDEFAKLYWIDHPYRDEHGDWKMAIYFKKLPEGEIRRCDVHWGTLGLLRYGHIYKGGNLLTTDEEIPNNFGVYLNRKQSNFNFKKVNFKLIEGKHIIRTADEKEHTVVMNAFVADYGEKSIHIPVIEMIRADLAKNRKLMYAILEPHGLDSYFIMTDNFRNNSVLTMNFTKDYPYDLLTKPGINHLLRISLDSMANKSWNEVSRSVLKKDNNGIRFPFPYDGDFDMECRYRETDSIIRVEEITRICSHKGIEFISNVIIKSPHLKHAVNSNRSKQIKFINKNPQEDITLDAENGNAKKSEKTITIEGTEHIYEKYPNLIFAKSGTVARNSKEDENTQVHIKEDSDVVTTGDIGGMDKLEGLEFEYTSSQVKKFGGELGEFIEILKSMELQYAGVQVRVMVGNLPEGAKGKKFCKLDDGITPRKYILAEIVFYKSKKLFLLEIERNGKSLSTLVIAQDNLLAQDNLNNYINRILMGLVNNNGNWDNEVLDKLEFEGLEIRRLKHIFSTSRIGELAEKLYERLVALI